MYQVPACVTLAQAILESATSVGWGSSSLFRIANNPFGIKFSHRTIEPSHDREIGRSGGRANGRPSTPSEPEELAIAKSGTQVRTSPQIAGSPDHPISRSTDLPIAGSPDLLLPGSYGAFDAQTWEIENGQKKVIMAQFQRFPNLTAAFAAHAQLLCSPRYKPAFDVRHDWKQFAERLGPKSSLLDTAHCGYSTNPSYSAELTTLVDSYQLDDSRTLRWYASGTADSYPRCAAS